jgi:hypothetical protein
MIVAIRRAIACSWRAWHEVPGNRRPKEPSRLTCPVLKGPTKAGRHTDWWLYFLPYWPPVAAASNDIWRWRNIPSSVIFLPSRSVT